MNVIESACRVANWPSREVFGIHLATANCLLSWTGFKEFYLRFVWQAVRADRHNRVACLSPDAGNLNPIAFPQTNFHSRLVVPRRRSRAKLRYRRLHP